MKTTILLAVTAALAISYPATLQAGTTPPAQPSKDGITPIGELRRGTMVTVRGTVDRITDEDEFRLADKTGRVRVYVGPNWVPVDTGEEVTVRGFVDNDIGPLEIYARTLTRADGSVVNFKPRSEE